MWLPVVLLAALLAAAVLSVGLGSVRLSPGIVWDALRGEGDAGTLAIVRGLRLPRVALAMCVGAALGMAGSALQVTLRNPLAEPYLLGVSGGAAVGAVGVVALGVAAVPFVSGAAFVGAMAAVGTILALARGRSGERLLMAGVVTGTLANAAIMIVLADASPTAQRSALWWMMGSVSVARWGDVAWLGAMLLVVGGALLAGARILDLLALGEDSAAALGVVPERAVRRTFVLASLLAAGTVATAGLVGFVGLIVPHLARTMPGTRGTRGVLVLSGLLGALLVVLADLASRLLRPPGELPLGAITALFGVPFFLWLLRRVR